MTMKMEDFISFQLPILIMIDILREQLSTVETLAKEREYIVPRSNSCYLINLAIGQQKKRAQLTKCLVANLELEIQIWNEEMKKVVIGEQCIYDVLTGGVQERFKRYMEKLIEEEKLERMI